MADIHLLADDVVNKIAAGEVVERPASVVKELIDNAIDAGAKTIVVDLKAGGTESISVTDDGRGMSAEDCRLAIRRHATSKIHSADDLFAISSMGFRGEALAAITSVSRFSLVSTQSDGQGTRLSIQGDQIQESSWAGPKGTTVVVEDLFAALPARRKFLKSVGSEYTQCMEVIHAAVLAHPGVSFIVTHNNKEQLRVHPESEAESYESRLRHRAALLVKDGVEALVYLEAQGKFGRLRGLVSPPGYEKTNGRYIWTLVNGRRVKDALLRHAILRGYHTHLLKGCFPIAILDLEVEPSIVDVNVHPAKTEIRFQYAREMQDFVTFAIRDRLRQGAWAASPSAATLATEAIEKGAKPRRDGYAAAIRDKASIDRLLYEKPAPSARKVSVAGEPPVQTSFVSAKTNGGEDRMSQGTEEVIPWRELKFVGCFERAYLMFSAGDRLLVVDQHAFHERILFEQLSRDPALLGQSQPLLVPESLSLPAPVVAKLRDAKDELTQKGFAFTAIDDQTIEVQSVPTILSGKDVARVFHEIGDQLETRDALPETSELAMLTLATIACHSAVRFGDEVTDDDLQQMIAQAQGVDFYHNCPHGRRVFKWFTRSQIDHWFDR